MRGKATGDDVPVTRRRKMLDDLTLIAVYAGAAVRISVLRNGEDTGLRLGAGYELGENAFPSRRGLSLRGKTVLSRRLSEILRFVRA